MDDLDDCIGIIDVAPAARLGCGPPPAPARPWPTPDGVETTRPWPTPDGVETTRRVVSEDETTRRVVSTHAHDVCGAGRAALSQSTEGIRALDLRYTLCVAYVRSIDCGIFLQMRLNSPTQPHPGGIVRRCEACGLANIPERRTCKRCGHVLD